MEISTSPGEIDGATAAGAAQAPAGVGADQAGTIGATSGRAGTTGGATGELMIDARDSPGSIVPRIELLVIQPTPFCNIDCSYCYLPDRNSKAVVARDTLATLFAQVFASGWV